MLCGVFAGMAGYVFASKYRQVMTVAGSGYEMTAIAACVLGGISLSVRSVAALVLELQQ